jgi:hypothetical protein
VIGYALLFAVLAMALARFLASGFLPATRSINGDFAAVFPTQYFAHLRPDFPTAAVWSGWRYGPMVHFLTLPLFLVPRWSLVPVVWATVNLAAIVVSFFLVRRLALARPAPMTATAILAAAWMFYQPLANCLAQGNVELIEMALILAAVVALPRGKGALSGALIGVATMIKFLPGGFLCWFLLRRQYRAFLSGAAVIAVILAITTVTLGWKDAETIFEIPSSGSATFAGMQELSITSLFLHRSSVLLRDAAATGTQGSPETAWFPQERAVAASRAGLLASVLLAIGFAVTLFLRRHRPASPAEVGVLFMTMFMILPWNHDYYYVFALVPLSVLTLDGLQRRDTPLLVATLTGYLLISPPIPFSWIDRTGWLELSFRDAFSYFDLPILGALILWIATTYRMLADPEERALPPRRIVSAGKMIALAVVTIAVVCVAVLVVLRRNVAVGPAAGTLNLQPGAFLSGPPALALSPDGAYLAYVGRREGANVLCVQASARATTTCIPGTEDAAGPFFSPDGRSIAFFAGGNLKRVPVDGTNVTVVSESQGARTGHWTADDTILFATAADGITGIPATGGNIEVVVPQLAGDGMYSWPILLPSQTVLFVAPPAGGGLGAGSLMAYSRRTGRRKLLFSGTQPYFDAATARLHYTLGGRILSVAFDPETLTVSGLATPVAADVLVTADGGPQVAYRPAAVAFASGSLLPVVRRQMVWVDRVGTVEPVAIPPDAFQGPRVSPDGRHVVAGIRGVITDLWKFDLATGAKTRLTFSAAMHQTAVWTPDGGVAFNVPIGTGSRSAVLVMPPGGTGLDATWLWHGPGSVRLGSWSSAGTVVGTQSGDLWVFEPKRSSSSAADRWRVLVAQTVPVELGAVLSPDGRHIAYSSTESGRLEIYVQAAPGFSDRRQVSDAGGSEPVWSRDGGELFYRAGDTLMAVSPSPGGAPRVLFRGAYVPGDGLTNYDVAPDGKRFLMLRDAAAPSASVTTLAIKSLEPR